MPLGRLVLMFFIVIAAAGATIWLGTLLSTTFEISGAGWIVMVPVTLVSYLVWRVVYDRQRKTQDVPDDRVKK